jgi:hypothetical protein
MRARMNTSNKVLAKQSGSDRTKETVTSINFI